MVALVAAFNPILRQQPNLLSLQSDVRQWTNTIRVSPPRSQPARKGPSYIIRDKSQSVRLFPPFLGRPQGITCQSTGQYCSQFSKKLNYFNLNENINPGNISPFSYHPFTITPHHIIRIHALNHFSHQQTQNKQCSCIFIKELPSIFDTWYSTI